MAGTLVEKVIERTRREFPDGELRYPDTMMQKFCHMAQAMAEDLLELRHSSTTINLTAGTKWYSLPDRIISIEAVAMILPGLGVATRRVTPIFEDDIHEGLEAWDEATGDPRRYMLRSAPGIPALPSAGSVSKIRFWPAAPTNDGYKIVLNYIAHTNYSAGFTGGVTPDWLIDVFFMPYIRMIMSANGKRGPFGANVQAFMGGIDEARSMLVNPINDTAPGFHGFRGI